VETWKKGVHSKKRGTSQKEKTLKSGEGGKKFHSKKKKKDENPNRASRLAKGRKPTKVMPGKHENVKMSGHNCVPHRKKKKGERGE